MQSVSARDAILREIISNSLAHKDYSSSKVFREIGLADELGSGMRNTYKFTKLYSGIYNTGETAEQVAEIYNETVNEHKPPSRIRFGGSSLVRFDQK